MICVIGVTNPLTIQIYVRMLPIKRKKIERSGSEPLISLGFIVRFLLSLL